MNTLRKDKMSLKQNDAYEEAKMEAEMENKLKAKVKDSPCIACGAYDYHDEGCTVIETPKVKHTPGPWLAQKEINLSSGKHQFVIKANENEWGADVIATTPYIEKKNWHEANARLIAEAPSMLSMLKDIANVMPNDEGGIDLTPENVRDILELIARAEGQS
jgi:hypothetical protein